MMNLKNVLMIAIVLMTQNAFAGDPDHVPGGATSCDQGALKITQIFDRNHFLVGIDVEINDPRITQYLGLPAKFGASPTGGLVQTIKYYNGDDNFIYREGGGLKIQVIDPDHSEEEHYSCGESGCFRNIFVPRHLVADWFFRDCQNLENF